ncbi:hypothetical protein [Streptacidiphilus fuscans]|uniref:Lipoprotein n=1 Tax=Streptacidiphilus fuscans TaxID=2789292 RepID=A0A931BAQ7_9ACTN|nr:hypothetical protein [Streptacidiphilus fuscans]MBF9072712.1 hypothetical protein [Streptacidiphilus fuscans]
MKTFVVVGAVAGVMVAAGGCAAASPGAVPAASATHTPAAAYLAIARTGNARLDKDFDRFSGPDRNQLAASAADLRDIAATEHVFDQHLAQLALPAQAAARAHTLIRANEARASLTLRAADSTTLRQLDSLRPSLTAANAPVERAVSAIRTTLGLPPPDTS